MARSGFSLRRRKRCRRFGLWLGLSYLYATAAGAVGIGGCVHADRGEHPGHRDHSVSATASAIDGRSSHHFPCASGPGHDEAPAANPAPQDHGPSDPCDCLGDCSPGSSEPEFAGGSLSVAWAESASIGEAAMPLFTAPSGLSDQLLLPYPNAPPEHLRI